MNIIVGGAAGQGVDTIAYLLAKTMQRLGFGVLAAKDYMSRVRGGHNFSRLRIDSITPQTAKRSADLLIALNQETYSIHQGDIKINGRIIYDPDHISLPSGEKRGIPVPMTELAKEAGAKVMANTVAVGAALALMGLELSATRTLLLETFADKIARQNIVALQAGYEVIGVTKHSYFSMPQASPEKKTLFLDGNELLGMSALASGCRFLSAYPMTPATGIMTYLAKKQKDHTIVVEQAEDEIAAVNMALGASFAGARSLTSTSGGGFALMAEGLSLAGMTETPLVIIIAMRPGPATGLPTRTAQGDLEFALHAGHGEFPRAVVCATHLEDAFYRLNKAFDLADKYQTPVLFLSDQNFADTTHTVPLFDFDKLVYERNLVDEDSLEKPYKRYRYKDSGISPRALPGQFAGEIVLADSDEHDECGNIIEDAQTRTRMNEKRQKKITALAAEMSEPLIYGEEEGDILLIGWGSTFGVLRETRDTLAAAGTRITHLHFTDLWPLPAKTITRIYSNFTHTVCVENNTTGQFANLLQRKTGLRVSQRILKNDGRPFLMDEILREVKVDA